MRVHFYASDKPREQRIGKDFAEGVRAYGDECEILPNTEAQPCDVAVMIGVKSKALWHASAPAKRIMIDKGYIRPRGMWGWIRASVEAHHPVEFLRHARKKHDRAERQGFLGFLPWKTGKQVVIAGSSQKCHDFHGLPEPTEWTERLVSEIAGRSWRRIIYRPKPSWQDRTPVRGSIYSEPPDTLLTALRGAHVMVTYCSNSAFEAAKKGIPTVCLGPGIASPISSTTLDDIEEPYLAPPEVRAQWFANLAYCHWTPEEMRSGEAWATLRPQVAR